ncbi:Transcription termination protein NusB [Lactococcus chungangensis CAU 28 = DSM 22330]|uniref:Transcription termination protein NusB n=1 Tax=Pseudolactococcus chungangensis CAU 28 = DSM 22330 TaxID=1122154 RepID=A0ABX4I7X4_9LACT|nr:Transcription termination protein NusB [Lactococcus chungangensis CAU 28 = DSM 22330]
MQALYQLEMTPDETVEDAMVFALTNDDRLSSQELVDENPVAVKPKRKGPGTVYSFTPNREGGVTKQALGADIADVSPEPTVVIPAAAYILTDRFDDVHKPNLEFMMALVYGVRAKKSALDEKMTTYLAKNWSIKRLSPINRVILRLGAFEILFAETPRIVAINEAIELAKAFNDEKDAKFINAILNKIGE